MSDCIMNKSKIASIQNKNKKNDEEESSKRNNAIKCANINRKQTKKNLCKTTFAGENTTLNG